MQSSRMCDLERQETHKRPKVIVIGLIVFMCLAAIGSAQHLTLGLNMPALQSGNTKTQPVLEMQHRLFGWRDAGSGFRC